MFFLKKNLPKRKIWVGRARKTGFFFIFIYIYPRALFICRELHHNVTLQKLEKKK